MNVLVTGFAGTLGSAFTRHFLAAGDTVTGVDNNEWAVAVCEDHGRLTKVLGDFGEHRGKYDLVVHCAAYKHVDLIEANPDGAHENNVEKTVRLYNHVSGSLVFVSTDKAVEPSSYYGRTKLHGEALTRSAGGRIVRLGNIMGSSGSVIPKWETCIAACEPLPVTDPSMTRYMIGVDEAVRKMTALLPRMRPGETAVPEMGAPVGLLDIADRTVESALPGGPWLTDLSGLTLPRTGWPYRVIGLRPGEKLHEKLAWDHELVTYRDENGIILTS